MNELLNKYRATELTEPEKVVLADFDRAWPLYKEAAKKAMAASYANDNDGAVKLMKGEAAATFQVADDLLSKLVDINQEIAKKAYDDSDVIVAHISPPRPTPSSPSRSPSRWCLAGCLARASTCRLATSWKN